MLDKHVDCLVSTHNLVIAQLSCAQRNAGQRLAWTTILDVERVSDARIEQGAAEREVIGVDVVGGGVLVERTVVAEIVDRALQLTVGCLRAKVQVRRERFFETETDFVLVVRFHAYSSDDLSRYSLAEFVVRRH